MKSETRQYKFLEASWLLLIFTFPGIMISNALLVFKIQKTLDLPKNGITGILIIVLILLVPILISRLISFSQTTVTLNKQEIQVKRSSLIGFPMKSDFHIHYSQIDSYVFQDDRNWYWLKLKDSNGKVYRIWKFGWMNNKEFLDFRDRLTNEINWFNQKKSATPQTGKQHEHIKVAESIYQGKTGLILEIMSIIIIISFPLLFIIFGIPKRISLGPMLFGISGAVFTLFKVRNEKKNKVIKMKIKNCRN